MKSIYSELKIICSSSKQKTKSFAKKFSCQNFYSYQDTLDSDVDVIYVSLSGCLQNGEYMQRK